MTTRHTSSSLSAVVAVLTVAAGLIAVPETGWANGYEQGLQGAPSAGVTGAVTGRPDVPEAGHYNPAGWAIQEPWGAGFGGSGLFPLVQHEAPDGDRTRAEVDGAFPPYLHAFGRYGDLAGGVTIGVPYGSSLQWPEEWPGRFEATSTAFRATEAAPSVAWRITDRVAVGGGPRLIWGELEFERFLDFAREDEEGFVSLEADTPAVAAQLGMWADVHEAIDLGVSWRSGSRLDFDGVAEFEDIPPEMQHRIHDTGAETEMILPHRVAVGLAYEIAAQGVVSLDLAYNRWSAFETFEVRFDSEDVDDIVEARDWNDTVSMSAGAEYAAPVEGLAVRTGLSYQPSPAPEQSVTAVQPDTDRTVTSLGLGYEPFERLEVDLAYNFILLSRTTAADEALSGAYDGFVHAFTLGLRTRPYE